MGEEETLTRARLEFLKLEYSHLQAHLEHLENAEWKVRQLSITLWLAAVGVGLGLQGSIENAIYILLISIFIPFLFLYIDARIGRWHSSHKARLRAIEAFVSGDEYTLPGTKVKTSFAEFCSASGKGVFFPVLDFNGKKTLSNDEEFLIDSVATYPHMIVGVRRYFYFSQILGALIIVSLQLYNLYKDIWYFALIGIGPLFYLMILWLSKRRRKKIARQLRAG